MSDKNDKLIKLAVQKIAAAKHPVSFTGAGLSAESGISTFRDNTGDALWAKFDPVKLASQEGFAKDPAMVIDWYNARRKTLAAAVPNAAHKILGAQLGWTHITQNVDDLLDRASVDPKAVLHLHGSLLSDRCNAECGYTEEVILDKPPVLHNCENCGSPMRPAVIWFGEGLSQYALNKATVEVSEADLLLVVGTSAQVQPAAGLIPFAEVNGAEVIVVNTEVSGAADDQRIEIVGKAGEVLPQLFGI